MRSYESVITPFCRDHGNRELEELTVDLVQAFLESITNGRKPQTRKIRFAHLTAFFNFVHNNLSPDFHNPCNSPMLRKLFRPKITTNWNIIEKDAVDEIIFRSAKIRNRLIMEMSLFPEAEPYPLAQTYHYPNGSYPGDKLGLSLSQS